MEAKPLSSFTAADAEKLTQFLNFVANKAEFRVNVKEIIEFFKLLHWAQNELHKKVEGSVAEITAVRHAPESVKAEAKGQKKK